MNKIDKYLIIVISIFFLFSLTSCEDDIEVSFEIYGKWKYKSCFQEIYLNYYPVGTSSEIPYKSITFFEDSTGVKIDNEGQIFETFKWSFDGEKISLKNQESSDWYEVFILKEKRYNRIKTVQSKIITGENSEYLSFIYSTFEK